MEPAWAGSLQEVAAAAAESALGDFDAILRAHWTRVYRFALASLRDADAAQTLAQDCFLRAYRARESFRGEASVQTWLMRIAVNLVRDHARNRRLMFWKRNSARDDARDVERVQSGEADPESQALARERVSAVWSEAARLPERQRTVFLLRYVEEMDLLAIAEAAGLSENAVKVHLFRATRAVRARLRSLR